MLTKDEFFKKHRAKYAGLSRKEKERRWDNYVLSTNGNDNDVSVVRKDPGVYTGLPSERKIRGAVQTVMKHDPFIKALYDPFNEPPARFPASTLEETAVYQMEFTVPIVSDSQGNACFIIRPALGACYAVSDKFSWGADITAINIPGSIVFNGTAAMLTAGSLPTPDPMPHWCEGGNVANFKALNTPAMLEGGMVAAPQADAVRKLFAYYRPTACGVSFEYSNAPVEATGNVVVSQVPGSFNLPHIRNYTFNLNSDVVSGEVGNAADVSIVSNEVAVGPSFEPLQQLQHSRVYAAVDGFTATWAPENLEKAAEFRPTRYRPPLIHPEMMNLLAANSTATMANDEWMMTPGCCDTDPDTFRSFSNIVMAANPTVNNYEASASIENPPYVLNQQLWYTGIANTSVGTTGLLSETFKRMIGTMNESSMSDGDAAIIAVWKGVKPSAELGTMRVVMNFEGITEQRTLRFEGPARNPRPHIVHQAAIKTMPRSQKGSLDKEERRKTSKSWISDVGDFVAEAASTVTDVAPAIAEALGVVAALF